MTHGLNIEEYNELYKNFAGDDDFYYKEVGKYKSEKTEERQN